PRSGFVMYIPMLSMALGAAFLLVTLRDAVAQHLQVSDELRALFCVAIAAGLMLVYSTYRQDALRARLTDAENLRAAATDLPELRRSLQPGADVLLLRDP